MTDRPVQEGRPWVQANDSGVVAGRDVNLHGDYVAGRDLHVYEGPAYPRLAYDREVSRLVTFYTQVFVGRHTELSRLVGFATEAAPGYLLIEGPPAFGKTALTVQQRNASCHRCASVDPG